ncbi:MAG: helix-turn-helix domain-containing protein [Albidovulum sp.]
MKLLDIGEVSKRTGLRASALRYYEDVGLISSVCRNGLRRQYAPETVMQLTLISMGKAAGFKLDEISGMFGRDGLPDLPRKTLHQKADELGRKIVELKAMRDIIRHVADCPAPTHMECATFQRLVAVTAGRRGTSKTGPARKRARPIAAKRETL